MRGDDFFFLEVLEDRFGLLELLDMSVALAARWVGLGFGGFGMFNMWQ